MRSARSTLLQFVALVILAPVTAAQVSWKPDSTASQKIQPGPDIYPLRAISVGMLNLGPQQAKEQYNIDTDGKDHQFVMVQSVQANSRAARSSIEPRDLVDTVILGGDIPKHGKIGTLAEFDTFAVLCTPACLILVRHVGSRMSDLVSLGPIETKFMISGGTSPGFDRSRLQKDERNGVVDPTCGNDASANVWYGFCDRATEYFYYPHLDFLGAEHENWLSSIEFKKKYRVESSCERFSVADNEGGVLETGSQGMCTITLSPEHQRIADAMEQYLTVQRQIKQIRDAPHVALPPMKAAPRSLGGQSSMTVENRTGYLLSIYFVGPDSTKLEIMSGRSQTLHLPAGHYEIAASVASPSATCFYGVEDYASNMDYSSSFYITTQAH